MGATVSQMVKNLPVIESTILGMGATVSQMVKNLPVMQEIRVRFLSREDPLEKRMATNSRTLA